MKPYLIFAAILVNFCGRNVFAASIFNLPEGGSDPDGPAGGERPGQGRGILPGLPNFPATTTYSSTTNAYKPITTPYKPPSITTTYSSSSQPLSIQPSPAGPTPDPGMESLTRQSKPAN